jgi:hypothetical protein
MCNLETVIFAPVAIGTLPTAYYYPTAEGIVQADLEPILR